MTDARTRSLDLLREALERVIRPGSRRGPRRPRRGPDAAGATVASPRTPTLSGGAAAPLDA